ncbi:acyl carrier protein [Streptomyces sp. NEAU-sy36]|uniref:acyl carrier protein n=1 Tax=unclassified Streptomyces TaxID=2593676 RepID=UPI0015D5D5D1|nr:MULTISPECIES: phosphopantetheine-binding protein [unclassified Streptomyces]QLI99756.1 acyl carrier protein [Streptomyces sp. NEAU-sy36]
MSASDTIKKILVSDIYVEVPVEQIGEQDSLRDVLGVDSLGFVELRVQLEEAFDVAISDDDFTPEHFASVASLTSLVDSLKAAAATA